ncbi:MAG: hypothetical protein NXY57DRAFT_907749 [Lentinula lateritia]|nr:MAG: hypothetical protein NXY57DRAFT_907749 [Lentinula lateritia]
MYRLCNEEGSCRMNRGMCVMQTYFNLFFVVVNHYQILLLFSHAFVRQYRSKRRDENAPHIFAIVNVYGSIDMGGEYI